MAKSPSPHQSEGFTPEAPLPVPERWSARSQGASVREAHPRHYALGKQVRAWPLRLEGTQWTIARTKARPELQPSQAAEALSWLGNFAQVSPGQVRAQGVVERCGPAHSLPATLWVEPEFLRGCAALVRPPTQLPSPGPGQSAPEFWLLSTTQPQFPPEIRRYLEEWRAARRALPDPDTEGNALSYAQVLSIMEANSFKDALNAVKAVWPGDAAPQVTWLAFPFAQAQTSQRSAATQLARQVALSHRPVRRAGAVAQPVTQHSGELSGVLVVERPEQARALAPTVPSQLAQVARLLRLVLGHTQQRAELQRLTHLVPQGNAVQRGLDAAGTRQQKIQVLFGQLRAMFGFSTTLRLDTRASQPPALPASLVALWQRRQAWLNHFAARPDLEGLYTLAPTPPTGAPCATLVVALRSGRQVQEVWLLALPSTELSLNAWQFIAAAAQQFSRHLERDGQRRAMRRTLSLESQRALLLTDLANDLETADTPLVMAQRGLNTLMPLCGFRSAALLQYDAPSGRFDAHWFGLPPTAQTQPADLRDLAYSSMFSGESVWGGEQHLTLCAGLQLGGRPWGALGLYHLAEEASREGAAGPPEPTLATTALLEALAKRVSHTLERHAALELLSSTREQALKVLGKSLEYRSYETKGHTDRVTALALKLGVALDLDLDTLRDLRWGAYLHDIGKIAIPDSVLLKPSALSPHERAQMLAHVTLGEQMLREQGFVPDAVCEIVRHHHERWDGEGYPDHLSGAQIPLLARVFAIVDVYDALVSARPYKPHWSRAQAISELRRAAGHHLDPHLVPTFTRLLEQGGADL